MPNEPIAPAAPAADTGFVGSDGTFNDGWTGRDEFKDDAATLGRYKTVGDLAKGHMDLKRKYGKDPNSMVEIPSETSSDEVKTAWSKAHNVPDAYEYALSDEMAVKLGPLDDNKMTALREFGKSKNWSQADFKDVLDFYHTNVSDDIDAGAAQNAEAISQSFEAGTAVLKGLWLDGTDDRTAGALAHLQKYGEIEVKGADGEMINPLEKLFEEAPQLKQSPWLTLIMDNMSQKMGEAGRKGGGDSGALSADSINFQITELRAQQNAIRKENPVNFKGDPQFKNLESRLKALYQKKPV